MLGKPILRLYHYHQRWQQTDARGWGFVGAMFRTQPPDQGSFRARWLARNTRRPYRLTRETR